MQITLFVLSYSDIVEIITPSSAVNKVTPKYSTLLSGSEARFDCSTSLKAKWMFNQGPMPKNTREYFVRAVGNILRIHKAIPENSGVYECYQEGVGNVRFGLARLQVLGEVDSPCYDCFNMY